MMDRQIQLPGRLQLNKIDKYFSCYNAAVSDNTLYEGRDKNEKTRKNI